MHRQPGAVVLLHTSKRMHFIEELNLRIDHRPIDTLAYVKTYALH